MCLAVQRAEGSARGHERRRRIFPLQRVWARTLAGRSQSLFTRLQWWFRLARGVAAGGRRRFPALSDATGARGAALRRQARCSQGAGTAAVLLAGRTPGVVADG